MVSWPPFQKYKSGCGSATTVVNFLNTQKVKNTERNGLMALLGVFIVISIIFLNKAGLERSFLNTLTNKLSVFKQQLLYKNGN